MKKLNFIDIWFQGADGVMGRVGERGDEGVEVRRSVSFTVYFVQAAIMDYSF